MNKGILLGAAAGVLALLGLKKKKGVSGVGNIREDLYYPYFEYDPEFRAGSKEFYDLINAFETKNHGVYFPKDFNKEDRELWKKGYYYTNGEVNDLFKMFRSGYMRARLDFAIPTWSYIRDNE